MKPVRRRAGAVAEHARGSFRVEGHCYDACPEGQKDEHGKVAEAWAANRDKLALTGTSFGKILPVGHPLKGKGKPEEVMKAYVFNDKQNVNEFVKKMFAVGNECEPIAARKFCFQTGKRLDFPGLCISERNPLIGGSPDGVSVDRDFIVEIKTLVRRKIELDSAGDAVVPQYYLAQANFYMWLTNIKRCAFVQYDHQSGQLWITWLDYMEDAMETALHCAFKYVEEVAALRAEWLDSMDKMKTAVEFLERGLVVPEDDPDGEKEFTPIGMRHVNAEDQLLRGLRWAKEFVEAHDSSRPKRACAPRKRAAPPVEHTVEDGAGLSEEMVAQIKRFKNSN